MLRIQKETSREQHQQRSRTKVRTTNLLDLCPVLRHLILIRHDGRSRGVQSSPRRRSRGRGVQNDGRSQSQKYYNPETRERILHNQASLQAAPAEVIVEAQTPAHGGNVAVARTQGRGLRHPLARHRPLPTFAGSALRAPVQRPAKVVALKIIAHDSPPPNNS
jgi:hypothetical protein